jgi:ADP-heptose:LPS heptosyltransferase
MNETEIIDRLNNMAINGASRVDQYEIGIDAAQLIKKLVEVNELYAAFCHMVANDFIELSYEKARWQRDDWCKIARQTTKAVWNVKEGFGKQDEQEFQELDDNF